VLGMRIPPVQRVVPDAIGHPAAWPIGGTAVEKTPALTAALKAGAFDCVIYAWMPPPPVDTLPLWDAVSSAVPPARRAFLTGDDFPPADVWPSRDAHYAAHGTVFRREFGDGDC
jgi:hypothetical protein